jgi:acyl dehydratase
MAATLSRTPPHDPEPGTVLTGRHRISPQDAEAFRALCAAAAGTPLTAAVPDTVMPAQLAALALRECARLLGPGPASGDRVSLHGAQRLRVRRAAAAGRPLVSHAEVRSVRQAGAGTATEVAVTLTTAADDAVVAESVSLLMHSPPSAVRPTPAAAAAPVAVPPAAQKDARCSVYTVTRELVRRYAHLSGDHNPLHLSPEAAQAGGFEDLIAHGMLTFALVAHHLATAVGEAEYAELRLRFSRPLAVPADGATLTVRDLPAPDGALTVTAVDYAGLPVAGGRAALHAPRPDQGRTP